MTCPDPMLLTPSSVDSEMVHVHLDHLTQGYCHICSNSTVRYILRSFQSTGTGNTCSTHLSPASWGEPPAHDVIRPVACAGSLLMRLPEEYCVEMSRLLSVLPGCNWSDCNYKTLILVLVSRTTDWEKQLKSHCIISTGKRIHNRQYKMLPKKQTISTC